MEPLVIRPSPGRWVIFLFPALIFVALGIWLLRVGGQQLVAWSTIVFFGACALVFVTQLFDRRPRYTIDDAGIHVRSARLGTIEWADVEDAFVKHTVGQPLVCLRLRDPAKYTSRLPRALQAMAAMNPALGFTEFQLNVAATDADPERLAALIAREAMLRRTR